MVLSLNFLYVCSVLFTGHPAHHSATAAIVERESQRERERERERDQRERERAAVEYMRGGKTPKKSL